MCSCGTGNVPHGRETRTGTPAAASTLSACKGLADWLTDYCRFGQEVSDLRGYENHPVFGRVAFGAPLGTREAACTERHAKAEDDSCLTAPDSRYRGPENQFYRVEVHMDYTIDTFPRSGTVPSRTTRTSSTSCRRP